MSTPEKILKVLADKFTAITTLTDAFCARLKTSDAKRAAAARVFLDDGAPFLVCATVLPWIGSKWQGHQSAGGVAFGESLEVQGSDWKRLHQEYLDDELFVLGDFNQDLVKPPRYYGSRAHRAALIKARGIRGIVRYFSIPGARVSLVPQSAANSIPA